MQTTRSNWETTKEKLLSLTPEELTKAAAEAESHRPISDPQIKELLKLISHIGATAAGSDDKKSYMLTHLKSAIVLHGCPFIFFTISPGERHSPLALVYAGESIDIRNFNRQAFSTSERLQTMLKIPLAVVDYFHNLVKTIIERCFKGGMFGELAHYYGTIEYQGCFTPHIHMAVRPSFYRNTDKPALGEGRQVSAGDARRAKSDPDFCQRFLHYVSQIVDESMPEAPEDCSSVEIPDTSSSERPGGCLFRPFVDPDNPDFEQLLAKDLLDIVSSRQLHSPTHFPTCYKYGLKKCRTRFPRKIVAFTGIDPTTGLLRIRRNHHWVNNYNRWVLIITRANHDCQILLTQVHALAIIHYVMK